MTRAVLALALVLLAACPDETGGKHPLSLTLKFDRNGLAGCLNCLSLDNCSLDCGGVVGIFLVDADSDVVIDHQCVALPVVAGNSLRALPNYIDQEKLVNGISIGRKVKLEIAVYSPSPWPPNTDPDAGGQPECDRAVRRGSNDLPISEKDGYYPSFWGGSQAITLRAGDNPVTVTMSCVSDLPPCATRPDGQFNTHVVVMETQLPNPMAPEDLDVRFGHVISDGMGAVSFERLTQLFPRTDLPSGSDPEWARFVTNAFYDPGCLATRVLRIGDQAGPEVITCDGSAMPGSPNVPAKVVTTGYSLDQAFVDALLPPLGLAKVPTHGMIIGRVVDGDGNSVENATVKPLMGTAQVIYLDEQAKPSGTLAATSKSGWFVVKERPQLPGRDEGTTENCCQIFQASAGGITGCSQGPMGTVNGLILAGRIVVDADLPDSCTSEP